MAKKIIKLVTIKIVERKLYSESEKAITFRVGTANKIQRNAAVDGTSRWYTHLSEQA